jgi:ribosomal protein L12E/L44/L45/RPP1/RPP2
MKVNISGIGLIPGVGLLAPVYGKDLTKDKVAKILNYASFKVYVAATGVRITKKNIDEIFGGGAKKAAAHPAPPAPVVEEKPKKNKKAPKVEAPKAEEPVEIEQVEEPVVLDAVVEAPAVEEVVEEVPADEGFPVDDIVDDVVDEDTPAEEEKPAYTNKKKKRR